MKIYLKLMKSELKIKKIFRISMEQTKKLDNTNLNKLLH